MDVVVGVKLCQLSCVSVRTKLGLWSCDELYTVMGDDNTVPTYATWFNHHRFLIWGPVTLPCHINGDKLLAFCQLLFVHCHALQFLVLVPTPSRVASYSCDLTSPIYHKDTTASDVTILQSCMHAKGDEIPEKKKRKTHPCDGCVTSPCPICNNCVT